MLHHALHYLAGDTKRKMDGDLAEIDAELKIVTDQIDVRGLVVKEAP